MQRDEAMPIDLRKLDSELPQGCSVQEVRVAVRVDVVIARQVGERIQLFDGQGGTLTDALADAVGKVSQQTDGVGS